MDFLQQIKEKVDKQLTSAAQDKINKLKAQSYNRIHLTEIILQSTLGEHVKVDPKDEYLADKEILDSIVEYFIECVSSVSLCEGEIDLLIQFSKSLYCEGNYIDQLFKDSENFDFNGYQLGKVIKYCLDNIKSELYKEKI